MRTLLLLLVPFILFTSCSFNKVFLQPTKIPATEKSVTIKNGKDTTVVVFLPGSHQPVFLKNGKDTIQFDFTVESVVFKSANGNLLNGWFLKPKDKPAILTILHLHGNAANVLNQCGAMIPFMKYGFQALVLDYSGYGFSEGKSTKKNVLTDALSALDYVNSREDVKDKPLLIYGQSLGGHLSAVVAAKREKDIDGLIVEGAFSSHKDIAAHTVPVIGRIFVKKDYCAKCSIKKYHKPLLVIHSTEDKVIPFYMGQRIFSAANEPKEFYEIKKCHICGPAYYPEEISQKIKAMVK